MMSVREVDRSLEQWEINAKDVHRRMILAPTPRDPSTGSGGALARRMVAGPGLDGSGRGGGTGAGSAHHRAFDKLRTGLGLQRGWSGGPDLRAERRFPPALGQTQQAELKKAVQLPRSSSGLELANWSLRQAQEAGGAAVCMGVVRPQPEPQQLLEPAHRLGFSYKRPKKRLIKANESKRETFVAEYAALGKAAQLTGAKVFFVGEARFRADAVLRGKWALRGEPALVDSTSPKYGGEGQLLLGGVLETGEVEWMGASAGSAGGQQQQRNLGCLPGAVAGEAQRTAERDLG